MKEGAGYVNEDGRHGQLFYAGTFSVILQTGAFFQLGSGLTATGWVGSFLADVSDLRASMTEELSWARHSFEPLTGINSSTLHKPLHWQDYYPHFKDE